MGDFVSTKISTERKQYYDKLQRTLKPKETYKVPYKSNTEYTALPKYTIPIGDFQTGLRYNLYNSRILRSIEFEESKGTKLDPSDEATQKLIEEILLNDKNYSSRAPEKLAEDLDNSGQQEPAIISCDGVIWDGNRRIATKRNKKRETGDPKWDTVKCVFLPELDKKQLKLLEHRIQMAPELREDYDRITLFLDCRKRIREDKWTLEELVNSFKDRYTKKEIEDFIKQIDIIDEYLIRIGRPKNYPNIGDKGAEFFTIMQKHIEKEDKKLGTNKIDLAKIKTEFFAAAAHPKSTYQHARNLGKILAKEDTRKTYLANSKIFKEHAKYTVPDNDGIEKTFLPKSTDDVIKNITSTSAEMSAREVDGPETLANKALDKLNDIKEEYIKQDDSDLLNTLKQIEKRIVILKKYLNEDV